MRITKQHLSLIVGIIIVVAGGALYTYSQQKTPVPFVPPEKAEFGTLPALTFTSPSMMKETSMRGAPDGWSAIENALYSSTNMIAPDIYPCAMPVNSTSIPPAGEGFAGSSQLLRYPCPPYQEPRVVYEWKGDTLPTVSDTVTVWKSSAVPPSAGALSFLAGPAGKLFVNSSITSFATRDADGYQWSVDVEGQQFSFWSNTDFEGGEGGDAPAVKAEELIGIMRAFFDKRGVSLDSLGTAVVDDTYFAGVVYGYPETVTVSIPYRINGTAVVGWDGTPINLVSVSIFTRTKQVVSGSGVIDGPYDAAPYPSVPNNEALTQILSGGMNPYYGWGYPMPLTTEKLSVSSSQGSVTTRPLPLPKLPESTTVRWEKAEIAYLFKNTWEHNKQTVYLIPVYLFTGTLGVDSAPTPLWRSWVPAIPEKYFAN